ncbi:UDP-N-acetylglucosamine 2-epimerase [Ilumatobacter coccineus]|uniref:UDP-N-acetylglucosamine 2-epimerase n=1 Tax=Ilumatobacter coccineus TaxID=467094 RepID=UPI0018D3C3C4|nr:UDP-N-acetylglucosamine 2-epimerase [Ilumatobacter coccineus]
MSADPITVVPERRSILFVTGTRADFGKIEPLAAACRDAGHDVSFFVTGMHMLRRYGETRLEVRRFPGATVHEYVNQSHGDPLDLVLSKTVIGFSDWIDEHRPDLVVAHGDRVEALAVGLVCAMRYVPCAHIEGGELSGTIDELFRHCNTKLSRHHFVSSEDAKRRVVSLGESPDDVHVIGSPELDVHGAPSQVCLDEVRAHYEIGFEEYGIVVFHPVTSEADTIGAQATTLFRALVASGRSFVVIAPNNDPGSNEIFAEIELLPSDRFRVVPSMRFAHFSRLMKSASVIAGNSSLGVREAPFLGVPSLDVGTRQQGRSDAPSITHVDAFDQAAIERALEVQWGRRFERSDSFGAGNAAASFVEVLERSDFWERPRQKQFFQR